MNEPTQEPRYTFAEYLALDQATEEKLEYINGRVVTMPQATVEHAVLAANVAGELSNALQDRSRCYVFSSRLRFRVPATGFATYPSASVVCGKVESDPEDEDTVTNPILLAEILAPGPRRHSWLRRFGSYRQLPSLREYLVVSQEERSVEHYARNEDDSWTLRDVRLPQAIEIPSLGISLSLDRIYEKVFDLES